MEESSAGSVSALEMARSFLFIYTGILRRSSLIDPSGLGWRAVHPAEEVIPFLSWSLDRLLIRFSRSLARDVDGSGLIASSNAEKRRDSRTLPECRPHTQRLMQSLDGTITGPRCECPMYRCL